jgi:hypothetical protein
VDIIPKKKTLGGFLCAYYHLRPILSKILGDFNMHYGISTKEGKNKIKN